MEGAKRFEAEGLCFQKIPLPMVAVYEPALSETAWNNQAAMPSRGVVHPWIDYRKERSEKKGLLSSDGEEWRKSRFG